MKFAYRSIRKQKKDIWPTMITRRNSNTTCLASFFPRVLRWNESELHESQSHKLENSRLINIKGELKKKKKKKFINFRPRSIFYPAMNLRGEIII